MPYSFSLLEPCTNNMAEYEALIIGLEMAIEMRVTKLQAFGDSQLVIKQVGGQYAIKNASLLPLYQVVKRLERQFELIHISHIPRSQNDKADALAKLAASLTLPGEKEIQLTVGKRHLLTSALARAELFEQANVVSVLEINKDSDWQRPIIEYLEHGVLPNDPKKKVEIKRRALRFTMKEGTLYRRSFDGIFL